MFDIDTPIYTAGGALTIVGTQFYTIGPDLFCAVALSDGSLVQVLVAAPHTVTTILAAATLGLDADFTQWGSQYLIIVSNVTNGYWIWDGQHTFTSGTIGPVVTIESGGKGYTVVPAITTLGGTGTGASFTSTIKDGSIETITPTAAGSGWLSTDPSRIALLFDDGIGLRSAYGHAVLANGVITNVIIDDGGTGYTSIPTVTITDGGGGPGIAADIVADGFSNGQLTSLKINNGGHDYGTLGVVTIGFTGGGGSGATAHVVLSNGVIDSVVMDDAGNGYADTPDVSFIAATGTGATGTAILQGDTILDVDITLGGSGYSGTVYVVFTTGNGPAHATVGLMPFGVNGISVATFQQRVWVSHYPTAPLPASLLFTAPNDPVNFGPPGGAVPFTQEYLRYKLSHLVPSGSFLYLIGDSSVGYVTGIVQTTATATADAITTFSIVNIDPQNGTPWRNSVYPFEQSIIMVNSFGIHLISGGSVKKVSTQIDDLFNSDPGNIGVLLPSTAVGTLNGVHVFTVLWPIVDPTTGSPRRLLLMSDGRRWWTYSPSVAIISISTSEIDSIMSVWGNTTKSLYKLWQIPSTAIAKKFRTKLFTDPSIMSIKRGIAAYALLQGTTSTTLRVAPVNEAGVSGTAITPGFAAFPVTSQLSWGRTQAQGEGYVLGWEMTTDALQFTINEMIFLVQEFTNRVP